MAERRVVLVGYDGAPSKAFKEYLEPAFEAAGWKVETFVGYGKSIKGSREEIFTAVDRADIALLGMSVPAKNASEEIAAAQYAVKKGKPYGFYADTFGAAQRPWFSHLRKDARFLLVLDQEEADEAKRFYPHTTNIVVVGNHEFENASFPKFLRSEIRFKLGVRYDETLVVVPGHKSVPISCFLLMGVVHALNQSMFHYRKYRVIFTPHPGDNVSPQTYAEPILFTQVPVEIMEGGKRYVRGYVDDENLSEDERIQLKEEDGGYSIFDLLPGAELMVESASTFCMSAAILRVPVISVLTEVSKQRNVPVFGQREWKPVVKGIALETYGDINMLGLLMIKATTYDDTVRERQIQLYPGFRERGEFARGVVRALERFFSR